MNGLRHLKSLVKRAFERNPAFELALLALFSISIYIRVFYVLLFLPLFLWVGGKTRFLTFQLPLILALLGVVYLHYGGKLPWKEGEITGRIRLQNVQFSKGFFGAGYSYQATLSTDLGLRNLPVTFGSKKGWGYLDPGYTYQVSGRLIKKEGYGYALKLKELPTPIKSHWTLVGLRYSLKGKLRGFLKKQIPHPSARDFLMGVSSGEFSNSYMSFTLARFGLNHLLAISGFHFALLLLFLNVLLSPILPLKIKTILLMLSVSAFYLFVGSGPSLARAWIVALVYLLGTLLEKRAWALNTLSLSMVMILIIDPLLITHLGFQFSFLITYAILLYTPKINRMLTHFLEPESRWGKKIIGALALGLSVHLAAVPLSLYVFHKFYLMGFVFNLFIPLVASLLIILFLCAVIIHFICPLISHWVFYLDSYLIQKLFDFLFWVPTTLDFAIRVPKVPFSCLFAYLILFFTVGLLPTRLKFENPSNPLGLGGL